MLAAGLRLGCILLGCVPVLFLLSVGLLCPAAAIAGTSSCLCRRSADSSYSRDRNIWHISHEGLELEDPRQ